MKIKSLGLAVMLATLPSAPQAAAVDVATYRCDVVDVAVLQNRVHVQCSLEGFLLWCFAVPTSSSAEAQRLLTMGNAALAGGSGKYFWVTADYGDLQGESYGCMKSNCRRPIAFGLRNK